jgi:hypothetical protein
MVERGRCSRPRDGSRGRVEVVALLQDQGVDGSTV